MVRSSAAEGGFEAGRHGGNPRLKAAGYSNCRVNRSEKRALRIFVEEE